MAKTAGAAFRIGKLRDQFEADTDHRHQHQLGDALPNLDAEGGVPAIPARDQELSLIVRVDEPDQVAQDYAVAVTEARAGQDQGGEARVTDVHRQAGGDQLGGASGQLKRLCQHGTQVEPCGAVGGIARQRKFAAEAMVENLNLKWMQGSAHR